MVSELSGPHWIVPSLVKKVGGGPSTAVAHIPFDSSIDESAPRIAAIAGGPLSSIKIGTCCAVYNVEPEGETLAGNFYVTNIQQDIRDDALAVSMQDARWLLNGIRMIGQFHLSGPATPGGAFSLTYVQGGRCVMNPGGQPNCTKYVDSDGSEVPIFCSPNLGLTAGEEVPAFKDAEKQACHWTPQLALQYVRWVQKSTTPQSLMSTAPNNNFAWQAGVNEDIEWPIGWCSSIDSANEVENSLRKVKEMDFEGLTALEAIERVLAMAGKYGLYITAKRDFKSLVEIKSTKYSGGGIQIARAVGGDATTSLDACVFTGGTIGEDGSNLHTMVAVAGAPVYIEQRISTLSNGGLSWAYSSADFTAWKAYIAAAVGSKTAAFEEACRLYPKVLGSLRITLTHDFQTGTTEAGMPRCNRPRAPLAYLLSSFLEGNGEATVSDLVSTGLPVTFEVSEDGGSTWFVAEYNDGFTLNTIDGSFSISGLRSIGRTFTSTGDSLTSKVNDPSSISPVDIRCTVAIPCDHRLTAALKLASDATAFVPISADEQSDSDRIEQRISRLYYADAAGLYEKNLRNGAYPNPQESGGAAKNDTLRDDTSYLEAHVQRKINEVGRINKSGRLLYRGLLSSMSPGDAVREIVNMNDGVATSSYPLRAMVREVLYTCGRGRNHTEIVFG